MHMHLAGRHQRDAGELRQLRQFVLVQGVIGFQQQFDCQP